jgi:hypothetical protein
MEYSITKRRLQTIRYFAGVPGLEPEKAVLETAVIPFHHTPRFYKLYWKRYWVARILAELSTFDVFLNFSTVLAIFFKG